MKSRQKNESKISSFMLLAAAFAGAAAAIFLAPWTGKRARNWVSQKSNHLLAESERLVERANTKARYGAGIAQGWAYKTRQFMNPSERLDLDDDVISQRVQTALGENPLTWDLPRINVNSENATVTVRGPVSSVQQLHDVERVVRNVKGVRRVINDLRIAG